MRVLYAGCPEISVPPLEALSSVSEIAGVLTNPDKRCGRNKKIQETPVKLKALELGLPIIEAKNIRDDTECITAKIRALSAELLVVFAYGVILPMWFLDLFPRGGINIHPSLLPKYRGPSPISTAILEGDEQTGITIQRLSKQMDAGNILLQERMILKGEETTEDLEREVAQRAGPLLQEVLQAMESGKLNEQPQREENATYCRLISREDADIDWRLSAQKIDRMVRAYYPWPKARTFWKGRGVYILKGREAETTGAKKNKMDPGTVLGVDKDKGILIQTGNGTYAVKKLQLQSKKPLFFKDFLNGNRDFLEATLGE